MKIKDILHETIQSAIGGLQKDKNGFYLRKKVPVGAPSAYFGIFQKESDPGFYYTRTIPQSLDTQWWGETGFPSNHWGWGVGKYGSELAAAEINTRVLDTFLKYGDQITADFKKINQQPGMSKGQKYRKMRDLIKNKYKVDLEPSGQYQHPPVGVETWRAEVGTQGTSSRAGGGRSKGQVQPPASDFTELMLNLGISGKKIATMLQQNKWTIQQIAPFIRSLWGMSRDQIANELKSKGIDLRDPSTVAKIKSLPDLQESMKIQEIAPGTPPELPQWRQILDALLKLGVARRHANNIYTIHLTDRYGPRVWKMLELITGEELDEWQNHERDADFVVFDPAAQSAVVVGPNGRGGVVNMPLTDHTSQALAPVVKSLSQVYPEIVKKLMDPDLDAEDFQAWMATNLYRPWGFGFY